GPGAREWLDSLTASRLPSVGRVGLAYFADHRGRIVTEMSVIPRADDKIWLITAASAQWHDGDFLRHRAPEGVTVDDRTKKYECLLVTGPKSRDALAAIVDDADLGKGWLTFQEATVSGCNVALIRVSFAGELGWEVHCAMEDAPVIWDALYAQGVKPFGMFALNRLRLEKGYRAWKGDLSTDYTLLEGGLDRFIRFDKDADFPGKAALLNERQQGSTKRFATMVIDAGDQDPPYMSTLWQNGDIVGEITSGGWGYRVDACIGLGMVRADLAVAGTELEVDIFGQKRKAIVQPDAPLWDPDNARLRA
ncbi:MAG: aminomethyltransferase family protein, partial [Pseudomonadota bacterium]